jgi:hypothetical protein
MREVPPIELLIHASTLLGDLCPEVVFVDGAIVGLLITEQGGVPLRATKDVDVAIELSGTYLDIVELDRRLLDLGFKNDMDGPTCRYLQGTSVLDVIPVNPELVGAVNEWYPLAIQTAEPHKLPNGISIDVIAPVCFLGTKLTAFRSPTREHHDDVFLSRDFNDMIRVIDGRPTIANEVLNAREDLRGYVQSQFAEILTTDYIEEAIAEHVDASREDIVIARIRAFLP